MRWSGPYGFSHLALRPFVACRRVGRQPVQLPLMDAGDIASVAIVAAHINRQPDSPLEGPQRKTHPYMSYARQDLLWRRRTRPKPNSATPSNASEPGSGTGRERGGEAGWVTSAASIGIRFQMRPDCSIGDCVSASTLTPAFHLGIFIFKGLVGTGPVSCSDTSTGRQIVKKFRSGALPVFRTGRRLSVVADTHVPARPGR